VIGVDNASGKLLPGMTATVKFTTASADDVLTVPATALRFVPATEVPTTSAAASTGGAALTSGAAMTGGAAPTGGAASGRPLGAGGTRRRSAGTSGKRPGAIYTLGADGSLVKHRVIVGITDGQRTEVRGEGIEAGASVVLGTNTPGSTPTTTAASNPLQPQQQQRGGRGPAGGF
jgi:HlyD family secretion protein